MGTRKCHVDGCTSQEGQEKDTGVTFHRFPSNAGQIEKWLLGMEFRDFSALFTESVVFILACQLITGFKITKSTFVCSRHFKRENFTTQSNGKIVLKCMSVPSIFPWNKSAVGTPKVSSPATSKPASPKPATETPKDEIKVETEPEADMKIEMKSPPPVEVKTRKSVGSSSKKKSASKARKPVAIKLTPKSPLKPKKSSKRLSLKASVSKTEITPVTPSTPETVKMSPAVVTPKKKNQVTNFVPGSSIEAQNFDGKWIPVKVIEVDMDEREVLVRSSDKVNKPKAG